MRESVDFTSWVAGWTALAFVVGYGLLVIGSVIATACARKAIPHRILVSGTRGKSGTVRLLHAALSGWQPTYAKITGTAARELFPDFKELETTRVGTTCTNEMPRALHRAAKSGAMVAAIECMAVSPELIRMAQVSIVQAPIVVIPTIRLDHLEEEGLTEWDIGRTILDSINHCEVVVTGIDQPDLLEYYREECKRRGVSLIECSANSKVPVFPGHHPTNVAVALAVAEWLGVDRKLALNGMASATTEPGAMVFYQIKVDSGLELRLVDLGAANDPQSAWEAVRRIGFDHAPVVPILVNRWERPLRALTFASSFGEYFPLIGVSGTLSVWMASRKRREKLNDGPRQAGYFHLSRRLAKNPRALAERILQDLDVPGGILTLLLLENAHESAADQLRTTFMSLGEERTMVNPEVKR